MIASRLLELSVCAIWDDLFGCSNTYTLSFLAALFVESRCDDENVIMNNIMEVKTTSPDYVG